MRGLVAPLSLIAARVRRRPGRWLLPATGIAVASAFAGAVAVQGVLVGDRSVRAVLARTAPLDRDIRVNWPGPVTTSVRTQANALLRRVGVGAETEVVLLNPVRLSGVIVRPAAIAPLSRWAIQNVHSRLGACTARSCPMLLAGGVSVPPQLTALGVHIRVVGNAALRSPAPLGFVPAEHDPPLLLTSDVHGLDALAGLSGVYRSHGWLAPVATERLHAWQLTPFEDRLQGAQASLLTSASQFSLTAPFAALDEARSQASAAPRRLLLSAGGAIAALALFVVLAACALRRDQLAEAERLRRAGARMHQVLVFVAGEAACLSAAGLLVGLIGATLAAVLLASDAGEPVGGVLAHTLLRPAAAAVLGCGWVTATALITTTVLAPAADRLATVLAVAAVAALSFALTVKPGGSDEVAVLLAPLACLAGGVLIARGAAVLLRAAERAARRGPILTRVAIIDLARAPALPSLAIAFVAVAVGLGGFALAYRSTLLRGAADQSADRVPLEVTVSAGADFIPPLALAPLPRWRALAGGSVLPVRRTDANYGNGASTVTVPALGVPANGLNEIHGWRASDGSLPLAVLARRLRPAGSVRVPGPALAPQTRWLTARSFSSGDGVSLTADLRAGDGSVHQVPLGNAGRAASLLRGRIPPGHWELEALELAEPTGLEVTNGHQNGENPAAATQSETRVALSAISARGNAGQLLKPMSVAGWSAVGAASGAASRGNGLIVHFATTGAEGVLRPPQPSDHRPVPVLTDPATAAAAGRDGRIALVIDGLPLVGHVVGTARRFPTLAANAGGFVVADEATLASALDAQLPGQGRPDELWIATPHAERLRAALQRGRLAQLTATFRSDIAQQLKGSPIERGVLDTLVAAALLAAALAVLGLLSALLAAARDPRLDRDLEAQGVSPRGLRVELRTRLVLAAALGVAGGALMALLLTTLAVDAVRAAGSVANPRPPLVTVVPWGELAAWSALALALLILATLLATGLDPRRRRPGRRAEPRTGDTVSSLSEGIAR